VKIFDENLTPYRLLKYDPCRMTPVFPAVTCAQVVSVFTSRCSLLTADIFALFLGIYLFGEVFDWLYLVAFFVIFAALIGFHIETWRFEKYIRLQSQTESKQSTIL